MMRSAKAAASLGRVDRRYDHRELIATQPRDQLIVAHRCGQTLSHHLEQLVTHSVPERIVTSLKRSRSR